MRNVYSIEIDNVSRIFKLDRTARKDIGKELIALNKINLQVHPGEIIGLLGPNGAGKTTCIRILCTLLLPTTGCAYIEGMDLVKDVWKVRRVINMVSGGETCGYGILTARENLRLFTELYGIPWRTAKPRIENMLKVVGLDKFRGSRVNKLSTGMRQRLNFARGFTTDPKVLFLDEPTVGLDVLSARQIRSFIKQWIADNNEKTILLTTHYMAEADELCDRIAIINKGKIQAFDTPFALKKLVQKDTTLDLTISGLEPFPESWRQITGITSLTTSQKVEEQATYVHALLSDLEASGELIRMVTSDGRRLVGLETVQPTLEDVFLKLTGRSLLNDDNTAPLRVQES
ncbi:MAG: ABC transporter ATP-binding protein [Candidatus Hatepunaea meridiana]|nr:ABC transporter ATP-binding protein [Candidatus Hatepunaea meridiana]